MRGESLGPLPAQGPRGWRRDYFRRLLVFVRPHRWAMVMAFGAMLVSSGCQLLVPWLIRRGIDDHILHGDMAGLMRVAAALTAVLIINGLARYQRTLLMARVGQEVLYAIRRQVFGHLQKLSLAFYESQPSGKIISRLTSDVRHLQDFITNGLIMVGAELLTIAGIVVAMFLMHPRLAALSLISLPLLVAVILSLRTRMRQAHLRERETMANIYANIQESLAGVRIVQDFARQEVNEEQFRGISRRNLDAALVTARLAALLTPMVELTSALALGVILWFGASAMTGSGGAHGLTVGVLVAFTAYLQQFYDPIRDLSNVYNMMQSSLASAERIFEVLDTPPDVAEKPDAYPLPDPVDGPPGRVTLENVTFGYRPDRPVLVDINLDILPGETVALVGPTGAGKTTLAHLVARFYDPQQGRVLIDGHDLRDVTLASLRQKVAVVVQEPFLFSGTVWDNLRYGRPDATREDVVAAAKAVYAHPFIEALPDGYDTLLHERGANLSDGQRQLLAFARALVADPAVLILDEATSHVDAATEVLIQQALARLLAHRTALVIAHRLSTIQNADRIVVIHEGRIQQVGTHEALIQQPGLYRQLYEVQFRYQPWRDWHVPSPAVRRQAADHREGRP